MTDPERRNKGPVKRRLPQETTAKARDLEVKWGLPRDVAVQIALGRLELDEVLQKIQLREKVDRLVEQGDLFPPLGPQVVAGSWSLDQALFHTRLRARKAASDYMRCFLDDFARESRPAALGVVGGGLLQGTIVESRPFDLVFRPRNGEKESTVLKHDVKFFFDASRRKHLLKSVRQGSPEEVVAGDHLKRVGSRNDVKARTLLALQESGKAVNWQTVEEDCIRGRIGWFGRYEVSLQVAKGEIFVLRHAVAAVG